MGLKQEIKPFTWFQYSTLLKQKILNPRNSGSFSSEDAEVLGLRLVQGKAGSQEMGNEILFYILVDKEGSLIDCRYQLIGESALIGAAEAIVELIVGKNYDQARRLSIEVIDKHLLDKGKEHSFAKETLEHVELALEALHEALMQCMDIPLSLHYVAPPIDSHPIEGEGYPGFKDLTLKQKLLVIEEVLDKEVRPYIEMDAGGVEVINFLHDQEVVIAYQGACTTCFSSTGATLSYIQQVLRAKVDKDLIVTPNL